MAAIDTVFTVRGTFNCSVMFNYPIGFNKYGFYFGVHQLDPVLPPVPPTDPMAPIPAGEDMSLGEWLFPAAPRPGDPPLRKVGVDPVSVDDPNPGAFEQNIETLLSLGVVAIRIFLLCNALNWGNVDASKKFVPPPYLHPRFAVHLRQMLTICANKGMKVIPVLLDFGICEPRLGERRRDAIVTDTATRKLFYDQVLEPLLNVSNEPACRPAIFAWEVMNEPLWLSTRFFPWKVPIVRAFEKDFAFFQLNKSPIDKAVVDAFLADGLARIERHPGKFESTVGHRLFRELAFRPTGTQPQFHHYPSAVKGLLDSTEGSPLRKPLGPDGRPFLRFPQKTIRSPFLGEFAASKDDGLNWEELEGADTPTARERVHARLRQADRLGFTLAGIWPDLGAQSATAARFEAGPPPDLNQGPPLDTRIRVPRNADPLKLSKEAQDGVRIYFGKRRSGP